MFISHYLDHTIKKVKSQAANAFTLLNLSLGVMALLAILKNESSLGLLLKRALNKLLRALKNSTCFKIFFS